jgi:hypothetical protein
LGVTHLHVLVVACEAVPCVLQQQAGQLHKVVGLLAERIWAAALLLDGLWGVGGRGRAMCWGGGGVQASGRAAGGPQAIAQVRVACRETHVPQH